MKDYSAAYPFDFMSLRYFNAAGADPEGETGEKHDPETHLVPLVLDVAIGRSQSIKVFGTDYDTPDGTCIRDYIHVSDLAVGHLQAGVHVGPGLDQGVDVDSVAVGLALEQALFVGHGLEGLAQVLDQTEILFPHPLRIAVVDLVDLEFPQHAPVLAVVLALEVAPAIESRAFLVVGDQRPVGPLSSGRRLP